MKMSQYVQLTKISPYVSFQMWTRDQGLEKKKKKTRLPVGLGLSPLERDLQQMVVSVSLQHQRSTSEIRRFFRRQLRQSLISFLFWDDTVTLSDCHFVRHCHNNAARGSWLGQRSPQWMNVPSESAIIVAVSRRSTPADACLSVRLMADI
jgi:hypothetical protein